ncbi:MAG: SDR family oxidoreductase [Anaerolineae bacterium]|jgi:NAD(P)-dependent dehydrogenase (short-subunit alcohol dehydrogenase family)|nr:MAG: SDR family oxidoreductase [Anaerolineae bacterium]
MHPIRRWIVTGAASGIGLAVVRLLAAQGEHAVLWDSNAAELEKTARELGCSFVVVDVTQQEQVQQAMTQAVAQLGGLDVLIHCAGILRTGLFEEMTPDTSQKLVSVNLVGTLLVTHAALPFLKQNRGSLILAGSVSSFYGVPEYAIYGATKAAVMNLAQALRVEQPDVHIGIFNPNTVDTPMVRGLDQPTRFIHKFGMIHSAEEVAAAILRGVERRQFMIWPSVQPRLLFLLTRILNPFLSYRLMKRLWKV